MLNSFKDLGRYKIDFDESLQAERKLGHSIAKEDLIWYEQVPCANDGFIYLFSKDKLRVYFPSKEVCNNRSRTLTNMKIEHKLILCSVEGLIEFNLADYKSVFKLLKGKKLRGRTLSEDEKKKLIENGKSNRFERKARIA